MCEFAHTCRVDLDFTVVDPAEGMLKHTKEYVKTYKASAEALPFDDKSFEDKRLHYKQTLKMFIDLRKQIQHTRIKL